MGYLHKKDNTERARGLGSKMRARGMGNHDSPEIPDMRVTLDIRGLPSRYNYVVVFGYVFMGTRTVQVYK